MGWLSLLNPASLGFKVAVFLLIIAATNTFTAIKVHNYVATEYQNLALTEKVAIVTREKTIAVLDTKTLNTALNQQRDRITKENEQRRILDEIERSHNTSVVPWCELDPFELCIWNSENVGFVGRAASAQCRAGVSEPPKDSGGQAAKPVEQQAGNPEVVH